MLTFCHFSLVTGLQQQSPKFLSLGTGFLEDSFFVDQVGGGRRWFQDDTSELHLFCCC